MDDLVPCSGCKKPRVLKMGDYCVECALDPSTQHQYFVVKPDTLDHIARVTGMAREFLNAKQERAFEEFKRYVIYLADDEWKDIVISEKVPLDFAMKNLMEKAWKNTTRPEH
jgi:hypothetical protein